jgi:hypothetical protein
MVELPYDIWSVIINHLTIDETSKEIRHINLAFVSSVSKQTNLICNKLKRQFDIATKAKPAKFQEYFASKGYLSCIIYAHENRCLWDKYTCSEAAENGHLECLKYAHENGCEWDVDTCYKAAKNGHLECLKYARENGCLWIAMTCFYASSGGHLHCLKYAHEKGCLWDDWTVMTQLRIINKRVVVLP